MGGLHQGRILFYKAECFFPCFNENRSIPKEMGHPEMWQPGLACAEEFPGTPQTQVPLGNLKSVGGPLHSAEANLCLFGRTVLSKQDTFRWITTSADSPPQLMQLGKTKSFCMLHHHDRGIRDVDPNFDDSRSHQDLNLPFLKLHHDGLFLLTFHPAMEKSDPELRKDSLLELLSHPGCIPELQFFRLFHQRVDDEDLPTFPHLFL